ncbi:hypothetical protein D3C81_1676190 [compost metagenome]
MERFVWKRWKEIFGWSRVAGDRANYCLFVATNAGFGPERNGGSGSRFACKGEREPKRTFAYGYTWDICTKRLDHSR